MDILVIGELNFDKTAISEKFCQVGKCYCVIEPYIYKIVHHVSGDDIQFIIWNIPDSQITEDNFTNVSGALLLYDETDIGSLNRLRVSWNERLSHICDCSLILMAGVRNGMRNRAHTTSVSDDDVKTMSDVVEALDCLHVDLAQAETVGKVFERFFAEWYTPNPTTKRVRSISLKSLRSPRFWFK